MPTLHASFLDILYYSTLIQNYFFFFFFLLCFNTIWIPIYTLTRALMPREPRLLHVSDIVLHSFLRRVARQSPVHVCAHNEDSCIVFYSLSLFV
jgi:hypothetical protein